MASNAVLLCLVIIQGINAALINQVGPASCQLETRQLSSQIGLAASSARLEVSSAVVNNKNNIALVRQNIELQVQALWDEANAIAGPNGQLCRNGLVVDLAQLDNQALDVCNANADIDLLHGKVNQINNLKGVANQLCNSCVPQFPLPSQSEDRDNCVNVQIENVQSQLNDLQAQISSGVDDLVTKSAQCVQEAEGNADNVITNTKTNLDACAQASSV